MGFALTALLREPLVFEAFGNSKQRRYCNFYCVYMISEPMCAYMYVGMYLGWLGLVLYGFVGLSGRLGLIRLGSLGCGGQ